MAGLTLGVMAIIVVLSVFNGSQGIMRDRTLITVPHGNINADSDFAFWQEATTLLTQNPEIEGIAPYIALEALLSRQGYHQVTEIKAISPDNEASVSTIAENMVQGSFDSLVPGANRIILGRTLATNLRLNLGDAVNLIVPVISGNNSLQLNMHRFTVSGVFDPQFTIGSELALIHIQDSSALLGLEDINQSIQLRLRVNDPDQAASVIASSVKILQAEFPEQQFSGRDWSITEASLFSALKMEKLLTWFMLMMIVAIGAFNIVSTLVMVVSEKKADIAILRTMGASDKTIMAIFVVQGTVVGVLGTIAGALTGVFIASNFSSFSSALEQLLAPVDLYVISALPARLESFDVWVTCCAALVISFLATLYPAYKASQILPAEVLRYE